MTQNWSCTFIVIERHTGHVVQVEAPVSVLQCHTVYGALRGLETLSQLLGAAPHDSSTVAEPRSDITAPVTVIFSTPWRPLSAAVTNCWHSFMHFVVSLSHPADRHTHVDTQQGHQSPDTLYIPLDAASLDSPNAQLSDESLITASADSAYDSSTAAPMLKSNLFGSPAKLEKDPLSSAKVEDPSLHQHKHHKERHNKPNKKHHRKHHKKHHKARIHYVINATAVSDAPRFRHRGLLLDTSRHFLPVQTIKVSLECMVIPCSTQKLLGIVFASPCRSHFFALHGPGMLIPWDTVLLGSVFGFPCKSTNQHCAAWTCNAFAMS